MEKLRRINGFLNVLLFVGIRGGNLTRRKEGVCVVGRAKTLPKFRFYLISFPKNIG